MPTKIAIQKDLLRAQKDLAIKLVLLKEANDNKANIDYGISKIGAVIDKIDTGYATELRRKNAELLLARDKFTREIGLRNAEVDAAKKARDDLRKALRQITDGDDDDLFIVANRVAVLKDSFPILLMPIRIETTFSNANSKYELLIRVYPDTCHSEIDRNYLTREELASAILFARDKTTDLTGKHGPNRAKFISNFILANDSGNAAAFADKLAKATPAKIKQDFNLAVTEQIPAPRAKTLPNRFVFRLFDNNGKEFRSSVGAELPESVLMGYDKNDAAGMKWMHSFDAAVKDGLGIRIGLTKPQYDAGFSKLLVLGIKTGKTFTESRELLEDLFENQFYSNAGLSLVKQGTATNNSDDVSTEYSRGGTENAQEPTIVPEPDVSQNREEGSVRFNDGIWLSQYLGIDDKIFQKVKNGRGTDQLEARAMNVALYRSTIGYFLEEMLRPLIGEATMEGVENFFNKYVLGRGTIPSIRIGKQPYGILPVSVLSKLNLKASEPARNEIVKRLQQLIVIWKRSAGEIKSVNNLTPVTPDDFFSILSLHPNSVSFNQRYSEDINSRLNAASSVNPALLNTINEWAERMMMSSAENLRNLELLGFDSNTERPDIIYKIFGDATLLTGPVIEEANDEAGLKLKEVFSEKEALKFDYIKWLSENDFDSIRAQAGFPNRSRKPLLYLWLRHSLLLRYTDTALLMEAKASGKSSVGIKINYRDNQLIDSISKSKTALMYRAQPAVTGTVPAKDFIKSQLSLGASARSVETLKLTYAIDALKMLTAVPKARLERIFTEHLDCCSYRIDAWINGLYSVQLRKQRTQAGNSAWSKGIYLGAFGFVEDLKPRGPRQSKGYLLAPSLNHAATGAVLKNAELSYTGNDKNPFTINISSQRVRLAKQIMDAIRNGEGLSELMGYRFERQLQDKLLEKHILAFRKKYPLVTQNGQPEPDGAQSSVAAHNVADGLKLLNDFETTEESIFTGIAISVAEKAVVKQIINYLQNIFDAIKDLMMAEGVFQTVSGNYERGSAVLDSLCQGKYLSDPEVILTPRTGPLLTHRVALHINYIEKLSYESSSFRANLEPSLNEWLRSVLPPFKDIVIKINKTDQAPGKEYSLEQMNIEPIDLLYLKDSANSGTALDELIVAKLPGEVISSIHYNNEDSAPKYTLFELAAIINPLKKLLLAPVFLSPGNLQYKTDAGAAAPNVISQNHLRRLNKVFEQIDKNINLNYFANLHNKQAVEIRKNLLTLAASSTLLFANDISFFTVMQSLQNKDLTDDEFEKLKEQIMLLIKSFKHKLYVQREALKAIIIKLTTELARQKGQNQLAPYYYNAFFEELKNALGDDVVMLPFYTLDTPAFNELLTSIRGKDQLLRFGREKLKMDFPVEQWINGAARVRPKMAAVETLVDMVPLIKNKPIKLTPVQLPFIEKEPWMAIQFSTNDEQIAGADRLLYTILGMDEVNAGSTVCGFMLDEWPEKIPVKEETAGLSFHYNRPNIEAPQTMLLVTPPEISDDWDFEDIADAVLSAFDMSKIRAVSPAELDKTALGQFLPATVLFSSLYDTTVTTNLAQNI